MNTRTQKTEEQARQYRYTYARGGRIFAVWPYDKEEFRLPTELRDHYEDFITAAHQHQATSSAETAKALALASAILSAALNRGRRRAA